MAITPHSLGIVRQRQLSDFLNAELLHTLGAYRLSVEKFKELEGELRGGEEAEVALLKACEGGLECNKELQLSLYHPDADRHPSPGAVREFKPDVDLLESMAEFYDAGAAALRLTMAGEGSPDDAGRRLGRILSVVHDPQRRGKSSDRQLRELGQGRVMRMEARRAKVLKILDEPAAGTVGAGERGTPAGELFDPILEDHIQGSRLLHVTILKAMSEAHTWMHLAEHLRGQLFGEMFSTVAETYAKAQRMLRYSLALNTFVFVAARTAPWVFAEDKVERELIVENYERSCDRLTPTYCMWTATQFSLLALHRRAFTFWMMGKHDRAYRDFYKLTRLLRRLGGPAEQRAVRVPGTKTFIEGVTGMSEFHIGRIYRGQHAHKMAIKYFRRASRHLKGWEKHSEIGEIVINSHWRIGLLINEAKANYELGRVKLSLLFYARAWRAFLLLADSESHATANIDVVEDFIRWLAPLVDEPELSRRELRDRLAPLVEQFETLRSPKHLELLAADILMRTGHLLYILKMPPDKWDPDGDAGQEPPKSDHELAYRCISSAARLDPSSTLIAADLLKIEADAPRGEDEKAPNLPAPISLDRQWPSGSGRFEEAARIIEYTLQRWLAAPPGESEEPVSESEVLVARKLLASFLAHTDSSNVKLAQVYRYLMQRPRATRRQTDPDHCTLDFVCLRRYSSFFPFLPRPTAFRAPGGGYFVQVREPGEEEEPFGIAIDPGPDFVENLYRCGYALADLHMIVLTHDHADHLASLDALLALMGIRAGLCEDIFEPKEHRLAIVGNESVAERYAFFNPDHPGLGEGAKVRKSRDAVSVLRFSDIERITHMEPEERRRDEVGGQILPMPASLRIEPVRTWGHLDASGHVSQGFILGMGAGDAGSSIFFTGDTGTPSPADEKAEEGFAEGTKSMLDAVAEADVVVAHLSAIPLRELRQLANLTRRDGEPDEIAEFARLWDAAREQAELEPIDDDLDEGVKRAEFLLRQLQFGFRSRPDKESSGLRVSPFSPLDEIKGQPEQHLYLSGLLAIAKKMRESSGPERTPPLLLVGELREELGTFRTRIASHISKEILGRDEGESNPAALTTDIGLRVRLSRSPKENGLPAAGDVGDQAITVLCTTCDLDNDLVPAERFHRPREILEVCVKGEDEGVFYNCLFHDPGRQRDYLWLEAVERYDIFGD